MTKKELQKQINGMQSLFESLISKQKETIIELAKKLDRRLDKKEQRWEMLKDYLKVEEKEYAELQEDIFDTLPDGVMFDRKFYDENKGSRAVKKVKLVKRK